MRKELSSPLYRIGAFFPALPLLLFWGITIHHIVKSLSEPDFRSSWIAVLFLIPLTGAVIWQIVVPKDVSINGRCLYINSFTEEIQVPLSEMEEAHYNFFSKTITITLKSLTPFGRHIVFFPKTRWRFWSDPKVIDELIGIINSIQDEEDRAKRKL